MSLATSLPTTLPAISSFQPASLAAGGRQASGDSRSEMVGGKEEGASALVGRNLAGMAAKNSAAEEKTAASYPRLQSAQEALDAAAFIRARILLEPGAALQAQGNAVAQEAMQLLG